jgi:hypothetical protein
VRFAGSCVGHASAAAVSAFLNAGATPASYARRRMPSSHTTAKAAPPSRRDATDARCAPTKVRLPPTRAIPSNARGPPAPHGPRRLKASVVAAHPLLARASAIRGRRGCRRPRPLVVIIVINILGAFSYFVFLKPYLFTSRVDAWQSLFSPPVEWSPILKGVLVFAACTVALLIAAWYVFRRKDILV